MKALAELQTIREEMWNQVNLRTEDYSHTRVVIGMTICSVTAGTRPILSTLTQKVQSRGLANKISVAQTDCIGLYQYEPIVEVMEPGKEEVAYVKMNPDKALEVMKCHLIGGHPIEKYTMDTAGLK